MTILLGNKLVILYTGNDQEGQQVQNIAFPKNLSEPLSSRMGQTRLMSLIGVIYPAEFRDTTTTWLCPDHHWRLVVGSLRKHQAVAILYRSKGFVHWTRENHVLHSIEKSTMWGCSEFLPGSYEGEIRHRHFNP